MKVNSKEILCECFNSRLIKQTESKDKFYIYDMLEASFAQKLPQCLKDEFYETAECFVYYYYLRECEFEDFLFDYLKELFN